MSASLLNHVPAEDLARAEGAVQADVENVQSRVVRDIKRWLTFRDTGGVHQNVYGPKIAGCLLQQSLDRTA